MLWLCAIVWLRSLHNQLVGDIQKSAETRLEKLYNHVRRAWWLILIGLQKIRMLAAMWTVKTGVRRFQMGTRTSLPTRLHTMYIIVWQKKKSLNLPMSCEFQRVLCKGSRLTDLVEKISRQPSIQHVETYCWLLLARLCDNQTQKTKKLKILNFGPKRTIHKAGVKEGMVAEENHASKKKPSTFYRDKNKNCLKACQKSARFYQLNLQCAKVSTFHFIRIPGIPA